MYGSLVKQLVKSKSGLRIVPINESESSPFLMKEPRWTPDNEVSNCTKCKVKFGITTRKHHCRRCGLIFCRSCCDSKQSLPRMSFVDPVRVCLNCLPQTRKEITFFDHHLKTLMQGANFNFTTDSSVIDSEKILHCRLSLDHRSLVFNGVELGPLSLCHITDLKLFKDLSSGVSSIDIIYSGDECDNIIRLDSIQNPRHYERAATWISAFHMGFLLLKNKVA